jgi:hypothetical protein
MLYDSDELVSFQELAWLECRVLQIPERTPLAVTIRLMLSAREFGQSDADGYVKPILDAAVGKHHDQWVRELHVIKELAAGVPRADVTIATVAEAADADR